VGGGASVIQQLMDAGLLDEIQIHLVPVLLGGGVRLLENVGVADLERTEFASSPTGVTHLRFRVPK
jgi:dihydrofolate reductase